MVNFYFAKCPGCSWFRSRLSYWTTQSPKFWGRWVGARDYPANPLTPAAKIYLIGYPADKFWRPAVTQRKRINNIEKCPLKTAGLTWLHGVTASSQRFRWVDIHNFLQTTQQIRWTQQFRWLEREREWERKRNLKLRNIELYLLV